MWDVVSFVGTNPTDLGQFELAAIGGAVAALLVGVGIGFLLGRTTASDTSADSPDLAPIARTLGAPPKQPAVSRAVDELVESVDQLTRAVENPGQYGIEDDHEPVTRASSLARAVKEGRLALVAADSVESTPDDGVRTEAATPDGEPAPGETDGPTEEPAVEAGPSVEEAASVAGRRLQVRTVSATRLLDVLSDSSSFSQQELTDCFTESVEALDDDAAVAGALGDVVSNEEPAVVAGELKRAVGGFDSEEATVLTDIAGMLEETTHELEECRTSRAEVDRHAQNLCEAAKEQTGVSLGAYDESPVDVLDRLDSALARGEVWFVDTESSLANFVADVETMADAQSQLATDLLAVLRDPQSRPDNEVTTTLSDALDAIDRADTVSSRLEGVDPDAVARTAERLLDDLDDESHPVTEYLRERVVDIKDTAQRSNDVDMLALYAARQELRYYDRTLIPELSVADPTGGNDVTETRLTAVENRRSSMRQSYPTEYPDCDHTIPIYFFDLVSELLETADELETRDEIDKAAGLVDAADTTLDWIEGLYETHSYFVLLKQLRG